VEPDRLGKLFERATFTADLAEKLIEDGELSPLAMRGEVRKLATWVRTLQAQWQVDQGVADRVVRQTRPVRA
jgi:hypothetical protein